MNALVKRYGRELARFAVSAAVPAVLLLGLAIACGLVRTAALAVFAVLLAMRAVMVGLERAGAAVPSPRFGGGPA